ncbi:DUF1259 domain-containing protein [Rhodococcus sp. ZPP]|uniref:DUF1259 domain-containing protein n=1 Tax=Rhodococcus sp. ZPP TaxID=2749906 RepID=UPI001FCE10F2|nr:DUF1259 domain-containing protein [Rhodococcus sp. ZPP]
MHHNRQVTPFRSLLMATTLVLAVAGCGNTSTSTTGGPTSAQQGSGQAPAQTTDADWAPVTDALGRTGKLGDDGTVYRVSLPRTDLNVVSRGVTVKPGLSLGGYAAFARYDDGTLVMSDLVVTEDELPRVTDALQAHGIDQTAIHKHLLEQTPPVWWTHVMAMGDPAQLAEGIRAALDATAIASPTPPPAQQPPVDLDTAAIDTALSRHGTADGGIYTFTIARQDRIEENGHALPPTFGVTTGINFQPLGGGRAAINGDIVMTGNEIQDVIGALRSGGIDVVEVHNHTLDEQPRLFYLHFWSVGDGVTLATTMREAISATHVTPGT